MPKDKGFLESLKSMSEEERQTFVDVMMGRKSPLADSPPSLPIEEIRVPVIPTDPESDRIVDELFAELEGRCAQVGLAPPLSDAIDWFFTESEWSIRLEMGDQGEEMWFALNSRSSNPSERRGPFESPSHAIWDAYEHDGPTPRSEDAA